ncbi:DUF4363 family protein [Tepidibacter hydrothermalis]|uniref:DUF4363 family protein n=1 Tax=Tepidibacter hydrothermalis TaxID=3036126 RepID=A0ABY8EGS1_9FIRM|nr:DUF4363 family protein [Tepidibacter hydrothermalis]WFD11971.1 DUF4363 family protein [Tepidibacter hydrothermalis]
MKPFIISIISAIIIIFSWNYIYSNHIDATCTEFVDSLDSISNNIDKNNWKSVSNEFMKINKKWDSIRYKWSVLLDHHELDNIDVAMAKLIKNIELKNIPLSHEQIQSLKEFFKLISENEKLTLTNIL